MTSCDPAGGGELNSLAARTMSVASGTNWVTVSVQPLPSGAGCPKGTGLALDPTGGGGGGGGAAFTNTAVTARLVFRVTEHEPAPVQARSQRENLQPADGRAVSLTLL